MSKPLPPNPLSITNTEVIEKKVDTEQALSRASRPIESTNLTLEVFGTYSLPNAWKGNRADDPAEALYTYDLEAFGMTIKGGKLFGRELTEEEKAEAETAKATKGKPPPKVDPKKAAKEVEPSA